MKAIFYSKTLYTVFCGWLDIITVCVKLRVLKLPTESKMKFNLYAHKCGITGNEGIFCSTVELRMDVVSREFIYIETVEIDSPAAENFDFSVYKERKAEDISEKMRGLQMELAALDSDESKVH